ncbi:MAG: hypothetical protein RL701_7679 [Pseudomonadota bacterium]
MEMAMNAKKITGGARQELVQVLHDRYRCGTRSEKSRILSEFVAVSGYHRKHAIRVLSGAENPVERAARASRPRLYDEAVLQTLIVLWEASDRVCGKRLRPLLPILVTALERHGHLKLEVTLREKVLAMSASTIDRLLRRANGATTAGRRARTKPALRAQVPVRTFADWNNPAPGSMEVDLVAHSGASAAGSFVHTLVLTDIASGWTECVPLVVREGTLVVEAIDRLRSAMPFALLAIDTDNGSEFMNETMVRFCLDNGIELTRSRPYRKNDQAWVEQKNGAVVRRTVGYHRLEGLAAAEALARLYSALRLFVNFFQPSFKLASKTRLGARVAKHYHPPQTPYARLLASVAVHATVKQRLSEIAAQLDPLRLLDEIRTMQHHLVALASGDAPRLAPGREANLEHFLSSLATAWREGEPRPTHHPASKPKRNWRTRKDPFETVWPTILQWLEACPDQTGIRSANPVLEQVCC